MKKIGLAFMLLIGLVSCEKHPLYQQPDQSDPDVENMLAMDMMHIKVEENQVAVVRFYDDTLAIVTETADIMVPKTNVMTKSFEDAITVTYLDENANNNLGTKYQNFQVIAFEDSENGDYDYNDLIVHVKLIQDKTSTYLFVQPVALGSIKPIKFGVRIENQDFYIADNCREELFAGKPGFINTTVDGTGTTYKYEGNEVKVIKKAVPCTYGKNINWFIEVDGGQRLYAVSKDFPVLNGEKMAYGLVFSYITSGYKYKGDNCGYDWFNYPLEKVHINKVYPAFDQYLKGNVSFGEVFAPEKAVENTYYPAIVADGINATEECLYAITFPN